MRLTSGDVAAHLRLVGAATAAAERPQSDRRGLTLFSAAKEAGRALLPPSQRHADSDLVRLIAMGKAWGRLSDPARVASADTLARLAASVRAALATIESDGRPPLRPRADIDG
jgi:hypothetical protein